MLRTLREFARSVSGDKAAPSDAGRWFSRDAAIMGTAIHVELWSADAAGAAQAIDAVIDEMHRIDALMSPYKESSEVSRINRDAARRPVAVCPELFGLLARSIDFSELSGGAFDITYASVGHLYDYRKRIRPSEAQLAAAREAIGYRHLQLDRASSTVRFARDGVQIDLGGFAKGYAVENGAAILARHGVRHAAVSAGGDSRMLGDRHGRPWTISIRDPRRAGEVAALLPLEDVAVSTSGDYDAAHIPGSLSLHVESLRGNLGGGPSMLLPSDLVAAQFSLLGLQTADTVVLLSGDKLHDPTLAGMAFERLGHMDYAVLNGGYAKWAQEGRPADATLPAVTESSYPRERERG